MRRTLRIAANWIRNVVNRDAVDAELDREVRGFAEELMARRVEAGIDPGKARRLTLAEMGGIELVKERAREVRAGISFELLLKDLALAFRVFTRHPAFAAVVVVTLAMGIGASTAIFSVVNSVLLRPLPYPDADALVALRFRAPGAPGVADVSGDIRVSPSMFFTLSEESRAFDHVGIWVAATAAVTDASNPEQVRMAAVSHGTLEALGVPPVVGRLLSPADQSPTGTATVMLNYGYWQRRFGGEEGVVGRSIPIEGVPRQIVGVMPAGFKIVNADVDVIVPLRLDRNRLFLPPFTFQGVARLKPETTLAAANADVARALAMWLESWPALPGDSPQTYARWRITPALLPLKQEAVGNTADALWLLMGTILVVMLIACANVANLLLVRAETRRQEFAIRAALGARSGRLIREMLLESQMLGVVSAAIGLALAYIAVRVIVAIGPPSLPRLDEIALDARAFLFALLVALLCAFIVGAIPAVKHSGRRLAPVMLRASRGSSTSRERHRTRSTLVVVQVALAVLLLVSAGLMIRTYQALRTIDPGFSSPKQIQTVRISIPAALVPDPARVAVMQHELVERLASLPGVTAAGLASSVPMEGLTPPGDAISVEGQTDTAGDVPPFRMFKTVSPGFFAAMGTRLVEGRDYTWPDLLNRRPFVIVSENLARELWGSPSAAIGRRIRQGTGATNQAPWMEIIGVAQNVHENGADEPPPPTVYIPTMRETSTATGARQLAVTRPVVVAIRSPQAGTETLLNAVRAAVSRMSAGIPLASVQTMQDAYDRSMSRASFTLVMLAIAGGMALLLGVIGVYGAISYIVSQRRREIGIRLALGAQVREIRTRFIRHGIVLAGMGIVVGVTLSVAATRLMTSLLFGVSALDPLTYVAATLVLVAAAALASYAPARRASGTPPIEALATE